MLTWACADDLNAIRQVLSTVSGAFVVSVFFACSKSGEIGQADTDSQIADTDTDSHSETDLDTETGTDSTLDRGQHLIDIHGTGLDDIYATGTCGLLVHYDGRKWTEIDLAVNDDLTAVWAVAPDNVFVGGARREDTDSDCYAQEDLFWGKGVIHRFDGTGWRVAFERQEDHSEISSIWGSAPDDIFAVGGWHLYSHSGINRFDGSSWSNIPEESVKQICNKLAHGLVDMWGFPNGNLYMLYFHHGADELWNDLVFLPNFLADECATIDFDFVYWDPPVGVWGDSPQSVFMCSSRGRIFRFNGLVWSEMETGTPGDLNDIWGLGPQDVYAIGPAGRVIHYDGASWKQMITGIEGDLRSIWGTRDAVYAVGDDNAALPPEKRKPAIYRYNGVWSRVF